MSCVLTPVVCVSSIDDRESADCPDAELLVSTCASTVDHWP